jgi:cholesterol oxidase
MSRLALSRPGTQLSKSVYEAIVVGTGFGGAVAACRLAQAGIDVGVLERGRRYPPGTFPRHVTGADGLLWERGKGLYDVRPLNNIVLVQAAGYGGGSLVYANVQMRPPADLFEQGWPAPYSRSALDPYYDLVAHMLDVSQLDPAPPSPRSSPKAAKTTQALAELGRSGQTFLPNLAITFRDPDEPPQPNRFGVPQSGCTDCGECIIGCNVGAKNTLDLNYLAVAEHHGAEVATSSEVTHLEQTGSGFGLTYLDPAGGQRNRVEAHAVFLCMGSINTTELLLRCRDQYRSLPNLSVRLGEGYSGNGDFLAFAVSTAEDIEPARGPTITTACIHDRVIDGERIWFALEDGGYPTTLSRLVPLIDAGSLAHLAERSLERHISSHSTRASHRLGQRLADDDVQVMLVMGRDRADGRIELVGPEHRLHVRWDVNANLSLYAAEAAACSELAAALGGRLTFPVTWRFLGQPVSVHSLGGCPMADDPTGGVVDSDGRVFGYPGLHVLDGSILPCATGANPSHTIAAVAERCVEQAIRRMGGGAEWRAPEVQVADTRVVPEDAVMITGEGTAAPRTPSGGLRYRERMHGTLDMPPIPGSGERGRRRFSFAVTSTAPDVQQFVTDPAHPAALSGRIWVEGLTGSSGESVSGGTFHLLVDSDDERAKIMSYAVPFRSTHDGQVWLLQGTKVVGGARIVDLWRSLTKMRVNLQAPGGELSAQGMARIDTADVVRLVASIRVVGGDGYLGVIRGVWAFERFFLSSLVRIYRAGRRARRRAIAR